MADKNYMSYDDTFNVVVTDKVITPPDNSYSDTLKFSHVDTFVVTDCKITGGKEDCIDIMRKSSNGAIRMCELAPKGKFAITIKGGVKNIYIEDVVIIGGGSETDIDIGNYENASTPRNEPVELVTLCNVKRSDGRPVRVRLINCKNVLFKDGAQNYDVWEVPSFLWKAYFWLRDKGIL
jgi:polygalacturonase